MRVCVGACVRAAVCVCACAAFNKYVSLWFMFLGTCCCCHFVDSSHFVKHTPCGTRHTNAKSLCMYGCVCMYMYVMFICMLFVVEQIRIIFLFGNLN